MAITQAVCNSWKLESGFQAIHDFAVDTFKLALYTQDATLNKDTTAYSPTDEISGPGYTAGGNTLVPKAGYPQLSGDEAGMNFDDLVWASATFQCRGGLIYNSSKANRAVLTLDFGANTGPSGGNFTIVFPAQPVLAIA